MILISFWDCFASVVRKIRSHCHLMTFIENVGRTLQSDPKGQGFEKWTFFMFFEGILATQLFCVFLMSFLFV